MLKFWNKLKSCFKKSVKKSSIKSKKIKNWSEIKLNEPNYQKYYRLINELNKKIKQNEKERRKNE